MKYAEVAENVRQLLADRPSQDEFIYELLLAYGKPKATITRLKQGSYNQSKVAGEVLWKKELYFKMAGTAVPAVRAALKDHARSMHMADVMEEREKHSQKTMAQLYDPDTTKRGKKEFHEVKGRSPTSPRGVQMPSGLREAHHNLDLAVDRLYRSRPFTSDEERLEHLFKLYEDMTQPSHKATAGAAAKEQLI